MARHRLAFGDEYDQSLDRVVLPSALQSLKMGGMETSGVENVIWRKWAAEEMGCVLQCQYGS
jgi:hypothetical protein